MKKIILFAVMSSAVCKAAAADTFDPLMNTSDGFCGLTRISGRFQGDEVVRVWRNDDNGRWEFGTHGEVSADASCVEYSRLHTSASSSVNATWGALVSDEEYAGSMWGSDSACFLSGAAGTLNGNGEELWVWDVVDTGWDANYFHAKNGTRDSDRFTWGAVTCLAPNPGVFKPRYSYIVSQGEGDLELLPEQQGACFLAGVTGRFMGGGEDVGIRYEDGRRFLYVRSMQTEVAVSAICIPYD